MSSLVFRLQQGVCPEKPGLSHIGSEIGKSPVGFIAKPVSQDGHLGAI
ncbi:MAG: hypothetical protein N0C88_20990 [Candidatus Thiodiazotropha lotti]|uniref:Uncharacterized protein n=1 Tax=Candidatus Thiodiazotropha lotti TaxID=2792787 RepID=A0A9E4K8P0_9GAMM|nr:hypothetical protein [Candidatus Thiodiazotropha lotti]MCG7982547.1 hypothetical protein [Candidatus Thiodiazotropha lotti]MCG8005591.1 hypothetical protein [Candidatus Thiodiazotropha lotti]MCW4205783.1 hypothetical protein [Candidatus Thiodiazotropha lotti]